MKKLFFAIAVAFMVIFLSAQEIQHDATTINVEVPVRVFNGNRFLDHLTIEDFENLELTSELMTLVPQNIDKIKQHFPDSSITINFLYITEPQRELRAEYYTKQEGVLWEDVSAGIFSTFFEMAQSTGGLAESSANIAFAFEKAVIAAENYYLLYYAPKNFTADGKFREIKVKVKGPSCRVIHRAGYLAD